MSSKYPNRPKQPIIYSQIVADKMRRYQIRQRMAAFVMVVIAALGILLILPSKPSEDTNFSAGSWLMEKGAYLLDWTQGTTGSSAQQKEQYYRDHPVEENDGCAGYSLSTASPSEYEVCGLDNAAEPKTATDTRGGQAANAGNHATNSGCGDFNCGVAVTHDPAQNSATKPSIPTATNTNKTSTARQPKKISSSPICPKTTGVIALAQTVVTRILWVVGK